jgi:hypothetical protein
MAKHRVNHRNLGYFSRSIMADESKRSDSKNGLIDISIDYITNSTLVNPRHTSRQFNFEKSEEHIA